MSLYGHTHIKLDSLKRWANSLTTEGISKIDIGGYDYILDETSKKILELQRKGFVESINALKDGDDWRNCESIISRLFYNAFFRIDNSSIRFADYYECLITASNVQTYKKIIKGFDYIDVGAIHIHDGEGNIIASIGEKSDLLWAVFFNNFVNENSDGSIDHTYLNHEQYPSIQLFHVEDKTNEELMSLINEILLRVSMEYGMDFEVFEVDPMYKDPGSNEIRKMTFVPTGFEQIPMLYLRNAITTSDERLSYLSYYQVIEYFFVRAQNYYFLEEFKDIDTENIDHNTLRKTLSGYRKICNERDSLKLVFTRAIDTEALKAWLNSDDTNKKAYTDSPELKIDISKDSKKIISALVDRVYSYRCSIAHAKGDVDEYIAIPALSNSKIRNELPLLKYLSFKVIANWSEKA